MATHWVGEATHQALAQHRDRGVRVARPGMQLRDVHGDRGLWGATHT
eukprot:COSAG01_NODE_48191_length_383_cov_1.088028_1_plen_46_part_10